MSSFMRQKMIRQSNKTNTADAVTRAAGHTGGHRIWN